MSDSRNTIDIGKYYLILADEKMFKKYKKFKTLKKDFIYRSDLNTQWLSKKDLKNMF